MKMDYLCRINTTKNDMVCRAATAGRSARRVLAAVMMFAVGGTLWADVIELNDDSLANAYSLKTETHVSVHDPSIFADTVSSKYRTTYYMLGSHLDMASYYYSLITNIKGKPARVSSVGQWTTGFFANQSGTSVACSYAYSTQAVTRVKNYQGEEVDFPNFDAHGWQNSGFEVIGNQWAPDIVYNPTMGKWLCYMSLNGDSWCSSIVCFASDKPTGPYIYQGPVVCSGFSGHYEHNGYAAADDWTHTDLQIATGYTTLPQRYTPYSSSNSFYYGQFWPNCIDPCVFYDEEGNLKMSYGSWSGGIWMLDLDETTGLRDYTVQYPYQVKGSTVTPSSPNANCSCDPYFGQKIAGGWYDSGEGSYIEHIGDYYYLFMSYGGFAPDGGYEMRVFRSTSPDGPYVDSHGLSAIQYDRYQMNYGPSATFHNGVKLLGGYQWCFMSNAELSQGHNSAITDHLGRSLVCFHTKFNDGTAGHQVRLHQLFQNQDGWLVAAPFEMHEESVTQQDIDTMASIADEEIPGNYLLLRHVYKVKYDTMGYQKPTNITLTASVLSPDHGSITGSVAGSWQRVAGTDHIDMTIGGVTYRGVLVRQTVSGSDAPALCFTVVSTDGKGTMGSTAQLSMWGAKVDAKAAIRCALNELSIPITDGMHVTENVTLPTTSSTTVTRLGALVSWTTSDASVMTKAGKVVGDGEVTLTLTITKDGYQYNKPYQLLVGDLSAIAQLKSDATGRTEVRDLYGRQVQQPSHGIYIINGKAVMR